MVRLFSKLRTSICYLEALQESEWGLAEGRGYEPKGIDCSWVQIGRLKILYIYTIRQGTTKFSTDWPMRGDTWLYWSALGWRLTIDWACFGSSWWSPLWRIRSIIASLREWSGLSRVAKNKGLLALWGGPFVLKSVRGNLYYIIIKNKFSALKYSGWGSIFMKSQVWNSD